MHKNSFTLTEVLLALGVFLIAVAPMIGVLMATSHIHADNTGKIKAHMLANRELGKLRQVAWKSGDWTDVASLPLRQSLVADQEFKGLYYVIDAQYENPDLIQVQLGIATQKKNLLVDKDSGSVTSAGVTSGTDVSVNLSPKQYDLYRKGGYFCSGGTRVFSFEKATETSLLSPMTHWRNTSSSGNIVYLNQVYTLWLTKQR